MPKHVKPRTRRRRKTKKGTQSTAVANVSYSSGLHLLAPKMVCKLKWVKTFVVNAGTTDTLNVKTFSLNGLYDPELAVAVAMQLTNFDQLAAYYEQYRVIGSRVKYDFFHKAGNPMLVGTMGTPGTAMPYAASRDEFLVEPGARYKVIGNDRPRATIYDTFSYKKIFGPGDFHDASAHFAATANPVEQWWSQMVSTNSGPGDTQASFNVTVTIEYIAECTERRTYAKSS